MAFRIRPVPFAPVVEEYAPDFTDMQQDLERHNWQGTGSTMEFPHNQGALEEKIDEEQHRKIAGGMSGPKY